MSRYADNIRVRNILGSTVQITRPMIGSTYVGRVNLYMVPSGSDWVDIEPVISDINKPKTGTQLFGMNVVINPSVPEGTAVFVSEGIAVHPEVHEDMLRGILRNDVRDAALTIYEAHATRRLSH